MTNATLEKQIWEARPVPAVNPNLVAKAVSLLPELDEIARTNGINLIFAEFYETRSESKGDIAVLRFENYSPGNIDYEFFLEVGRNSSEYKLTIPQDGFKLTGALN